MEPLTSAPRPVRITQSNVHPGKRHCCSHVASTSIAGPTHMIRVVYAHEAMVVSAECVKSFVCLRNCDTGTLRETILYSSRRFSYSSPVQNEACSRPCHETRHTEPCSSLMVLVIYLSLERWVPQWGNLNITFWHPWSHLTVDVSPNKVEIHILKTRTKES